MEKIYPPDTWEATEPKDFEKYFKEYQVEAKVRPFSQHDVLEQRKEILEEDFDLPLSIDDIKDLEALCTIDKLTVHNENPHLPTDASKTLKIAETHPITPEAKMLCTVRSKEDWDISNESCVYEKRSVPVYTSIDLLGKNDPCVPDITPGSDFIVKILVFVPFNTQIGGRLTRESLKTQYEIHVLGSNTLLELANTIKCVSDSFIIKEVEHMQVDFTDLQNAKEVYPSRTFFIENVFYNDMSHPNAIDYSEVVKKWAVEKKIGVLRSTSMEGVTLASLKPRLGYGYVYMHQGGCEHILSFTDARLIQADDCLLKHRYPQIISLKRHINYICFICAESHASWLVVNSDRLPVRKALFCSNCCESYMFVDGKKLGHFQLYPYYSGIGTAETQNQVSQQDENEWGYVEEN